MDRFITRLPVHSSQSNSKSSLQTSGSASTGRTNSDSCAENVNEADRSLSVLKAANLAYHKHIQQVKFISPLLSGNYHLLQVEKNIADAIEAGERLVFRGKSDDNVALCTKDKTYSVREAETSNSLLVLDGINTDQYQSKQVNQLFSTQNVHAVKSRYLEVNRLPFASCRRVKELLRESELQWSVADMEDVKFYTFADLLNSVQLSENELKIAISKLPIINFDGYLRMLSPEYRDRLLSELIDYIEDDEISIDVLYIDRSVLLDTLRRRCANANISVGVVDWLLSSHCTHIKDDIYAVNDQAICRSRASQLLRAAVKFDLLTFMRSIEEMLPAGVIMKDEYLNNLALIDDDEVSGKVIRYLNTEDMPEDYRKRLELLFAVRPKWTYAEIEPYMIDICPTKRVLTEVLNEHCRVIITEIEAVLVGLT